jgi:hypothetical protein
MAQLSGNEGDEAQGSADRAFYVLVRGFVKHYYCLASMSFDSIQ